MKDYQQECIEFAVAREVIRFGEFTLRSGRVSPYFLNVGWCSTGYSLIRLGEFYARRIMDSEIQFEVLFGPAYKGIPLVLASTISLLLGHGRNVFYSFNRKEEKDHGEEGEVIGCKLNGNRVLILDDVITQGTSIRNSIQLIKEKQGTPMGVITLLDREEKGINAWSSAQEIEAEFNIPVLSVICISDIVTYLKNNTGKRKEAKQIEAYQKNYGAR